MNYVYIVRNNLSSDALLFFLLKILAIVSVVALIAAALAWTKNSIAKFKNNQKPTLITRSIKNGINLNSIAWASLAGLGLLLLFSLLGLNTYYLFSVSLIFLAKFLVLAIIVSLTIAAILYIKSQYESGKLNLFHSTVSHQNESHNQTNDTNI